jgi:hypothetical protein
MIDKNNFYGKDSEIPARSKARIWYNIKNVIAPGRKHFFGGIELKSFAFGIAASVLIFFASVGIKSTINNYVDSNLSFEQQINAFYLDAISKFEKNLPTVASYNDEPGLNDDLLVVKKEQLGTVDEAIKIFNSEGNTFDKSRIKQVRLMELYKMKLQLLNEILTLEGSSI